MSRIKVLIVDDSPFIRKALIRVFESEPMIEVVGAARNGKEAIEKIGFLDPDVVTLDIMMPEMDGIETLRIIMENKPLPVLILSQYTHKGADLTLSALELGALDFVDKSSTGFMDFFALANEITSKVKAIAGSKPVKAAAASAVVDGYKGRGVIDVVAIGSSTGGPPALQILLPKFPREIDFGLLIVQHMPHGFTEPLSRRLDSMCRIRVKEAEDGDRIEPGLALIAPSGLHMSARRVRSQKSGVRSHIKLHIEPPNTIHRPSVDVLFQSVAEVFRDRSIAVVLTGMGCDGSKGMKTIKERGGKTLAQDEATSVIFGMPKVAIESGVVDRVVPITGMAEEILKMT